MALTTYGTFLMSRASSSDSWAKLVDIKSFPDLGGTPEFLDSTTLSDPTKTGELGIQDTEAKQFEANYTKEDYESLKALEGQEREYAVWFGEAESKDEDGRATPSGSQGKFKWKGKLSVYPTGGGVNAIRSMMISISASTPIDYDNN